MILRRSPEPQNPDNSENTFEAFDERTGKILGTCEIIIRENRAMFPNRPLRVFIDISEGTVPDALLGAAVARAKEIGHRSGESARVFACVAPEDNARMDVLSALGLKDNDGLVMLELSLADRDIREFSLPTACEMVTDDLLEEKEQSFFIDRYNHVAMDEIDREWVEKVIVKPNFSRFLVVSMQGLAGEVICWTEDGHGVIGWINVPQKWRNLHIASALIEECCAYFQSLGIQSVQCELQARCPNALKLFEKAGFAQKKLLCRYPGTDIDA